MDEPVHGLPKLARPAQRALAAHGVATLEDLTTRAAGEVARWHGIGPNAMDALRQAMEHAGLSFAPERDDRT